MAKTETKSLFTADLVGPAITASFLKLAPRELVRNLSLGRQQMVEIAKALSWQHHTVRGAIAGALKKKLGLDVTSENDDKRGRIYWIEKCR